MPCCLLETSDAQKWNEETQDLQGQVVPYSKTEQNQCLDLKQEAQTHLPWNSPVIIFKPITLWT